MNYASFQKTKDKKYIAWTAEKTFEVSGTQDEREQACADKCMKDGISFCKSAHLSPYSPSSSSTCDLFKEDVYMHWTSLIPSLTSDSTGWTTFHLLVNTVESSNAKY